MILFGRCERERVDSEVPRVLAYIQIRSAEDGRQRLEAAANIEDEGERGILLSVLQHEVAEIAFARTSHPKDERVRNLAIVKIQEVWVLLSVSSAARYSVPRCAFVVSPGRIVNRNWRSA